jgi:pyruvate/2-oxoglutarate dehydrogenase complex dihydrolipoamide dehydrogenase (E3) component
MGGNHVVNDLSVLPWAIFTSPEIAHVGLNEAQAREELGDVQVIKVDATIDRFITEGKTEGFLKVVLDQNDRIVGADAIGAQAGEWIQLITLAIKQNLTPEDFSETIVAYPTHADIVRKAFNKFLASKIES